LKFGDIHADSCFDSHYRAIACVFRELAGRNDCFAWNAANVQANSSDFFFLNYDDGFPKLSQPYGGNVPSRAGANHDYARIQIMIGTLSTHLEQNILFEQIIQKSQFFGNNGFGLIDLIVQNRAFLCFPYMFGL
jgi:hypothetical protein